MASIRKRNDKWEVQIRRKGFSTICKSFHMKTDALEWGRYMEQKADRRSLPYDPKKLDAVTLQALLERYRAEIIPRKRGEAEPVLIDVFMRREAKLCALPLSALTVSHFCTYRDKRIKTAKAATVCRELGLIQHALEIAMREWDLPLQENPVAKVKKPEINNRRCRRVSTDEYKALLRTLRKCQNKFIRPMTLFAIETGMRRGEMLAAQWRHVNLESRTLFLPVTKNGEARTVPLTKKAVKILRFLCMPDNKNKLIFDTTERGFELAWRRMIARSGIEDLRFHDLRHEAISRFFERGLSVPEVALISGHKDFRMLFRYTHLKAEDVAKKLSSL